MGQMWHTVGWEEVRLSGSANKVWQYIGLAIRPVCTLHFSSPYMSNSDTCHVVKLDSLTLYFLEIFKTCRRHAKLKIMFFLWPVRYNLWSCQLEWGYCGTLKACQLPRRGLWTPVDPEWSEVRVAPHNFSHRLVDVHARGTLNYHYRKLRLCMQTIIRNTFPKSLYHKRVLFWNLMVTLTIWTLLPCVVLL